MPVCNKESYQTLHFLFMDKEIRKILHKIIFLSIYDIKNSLIIRIVNRYIFLFRSSPFSVFVLKDAFRFVSIWININIVSLLHFTGGGWTEYSKNKLYSQQNLTVSKYWQFLKEKLFPNLEYWPNIFHSLKLSRNNLVNILFYL